jgi:tetratricopeptide (TPR) repeat protein
MWDPRDTSPSRPDTAHAQVAELLGELGQVPLHAIQRFNQLSQKAEEKNLFEDALTFAEASLNVAKGANVSQGVVLAFLTRGRLLFKAEQFPAAISDLKEALLRSKDDTTLLPQQRMSIMYTACNLIGASLWRQGDRTAAAPALAHTTLLARQIFGAGSAQLVKALFDQAHLAIEMRQPQAEILSAIDACVREPGCKETRATSLLKLGRSLYMNYIWDAAARTFQVVDKQSSNPVERSEALLSLAHIACFKSDMTGLQRFVDKAESLWMDVAPRPHLERHIAHLRAIAALHEGCEETYRDQMYKAQQREELEEPTIEDRIQMQFVRAQVLRRSGLHDEARREVEEARNIVQRAIVSPLARCSTLLHQAFCEQMEENYDCSNELIDAALEISHTDLDNNSILEARGLTLKAHNLYRIFTYRETSSPQKSVPLLEAKESAEGALRILQDQKIDHYTQKTLLRLLSGITNHLGLNSAHVAYDQQLALLEAQYPDNSH